MTPVALVSGVFLGVYLIIQRRKMYSPFEADVLIESHSPGNLLSSIGNIDLLQHGHV